MPAKQIAVISGKGGTGKTSLVASFAALAESPVMADCDVDAPDLHLVLRPVVRETHPFSGGLVARIDPDRCTGCGRCRELCRFGAVEAARAGAWPPGGLAAFRVDPLACEGCGVCHDHCPEGAVTLERQRAGTWHVSSTRFGPLVHAVLGVAQENSGKLVAQVRERARELAQERGSPVVIVDGPPGIGCPVISSITGVDLVLVCTEPTPSGRHDLDRVLDLAEHFRVPALVCVNKADLGPRVTEEMAARVHGRGAGFAGTVPYDEAVVEAMMAGRALVERPGALAAPAVVAIWRQVEEALGLPARRAAG